MKPGVRRDDVIKALTRVRDATLPVAAVETQSQQWHAYVDWVTDACRLLSPLVSSEDLDALVLTKRQWALVTTPTSPTVVSLELHERQADLSAAIHDLEEQARHWGDGEALIVLDTGVFLNGPDVGDLDLAPEICAAENEGIRLIVPMVVIDELDRLKLHDKVRGQARKALRKIRHLVADIDGPNIVREAQPHVQPKKGARRGRVRIEILFDPRGHIRLPVNDDEIIDRAETVQSLADREVWLAAFDTNQDLRSRKAGLRPLLLTHGEDYSIQASI